MSAVDAVTLLKMTPADVALSLEKAAELIESRGWANGAGWPNPADQTAPLCLEGGIMAALGINVVSNLDEGDPIGFLAKCPAYRTVKDHLGTQYPIDRVWAWNDRPERTVEQVTELLRTVAAEQRRLVGAQA